MSQTEETVGALKSVINIEQIGKFLILADKVSLISFVYISTNLSFYLGQAETRIWYLEANWNSWAQTKEFVTKHELNLHRRGRTLDAKENRGERRTARVGCRRPSHQCKGSLKVGGPKGSIWLAKLGRRWCHRKRRWFQNGRVVRHGSRWRRWERQD